MRAGERTRRKGAADRVESAGVEGGTLKRSRDENEAGECETSKETKDRSREQDVGRRQAVGKTRARWERQTMETTERNEGKVASGWGDMKEAG